MRKALLAALFFLAVNTQAQNFHVTLFGGMSNYQGDLQAKAFTFHESHPAVGAGLLYELTTNFYIRANVTLGKVSGNDNTSSSILIYDRNLNFTTLITDCQLGLEYDIFNIYKTNFTPYIFAGIGYFHFNPYTYDTTGKKVYLQPLSTEGEGFYNGRPVYSLDQFNIPFGGGVKFALTDNIRIGIELGLRKLFTDYLDDVSATYAPEDLLLANRGPEAVELAFRSNELHTGLIYPPANTIRGNPKSKDWYYFTGFTLNFRLPSASDKYNTGGASKVACPTKVY